MDTTGSLHDEFQSDKDLQPECPLNSSPSPPPLLTKSGRPRRQYKLPQRFRDNLPETPVPVAIPEQQPGNTMRRVLLIVRDRLITALNSFGIWRDYPDRPTTDPDTSLTLEDMSNRQSPASLFVNPAPLDHRPPYWPFTNPTIHAIMTWVNNGKTAKSESETTNFVQNVILSPTFNPDDLVGFDAHRENQRFNKAISEPAFKTQFTTTSVEILVPSGRPRVEAAKYQVPGLLHRKLTDVISEAFNDRLAHLLHYSPFKLFQKDSIGDDERIYGEIYTSNAFLEETENVRRHSPTDPDDLQCKREKVVAALMFSSDSTHLTNFGNAKAWPVYLMLGNLSKYIRAQPSSGAMHHLAYIPSVCPLFLFLSHSGHVLMKLL